MTSRRTLALLAGAMSLLCPALAAAQKPPPPEFTKQIVLVPNFEFDQGMDRRVGRRAADALRDRLDDLLPEREADVVSRGDVRYRLEQGGFDADAPLDDASLRVLSRYVRADELVLGRVHRDPKGFRVSAQLVLARDMRLRQPLQPQVAATVEQAGAAVAREAAVARTQLVHQRRCENALRAGTGSRAIADARAGIAGYPRSTLARTCLLWALRGTGAPWNAQLEVAREILALDGGSAAALEGAALALDSLGRHREAGDFWVRLAATDTMDMELLTRVLWSLAESGEAVRAVPLALKASDAHPEDLNLRRLAWRVTYDARDWKNAIRVGELMLGTPGGAAADPAMIADPAFFRRLASAYRANDEPLKAVSLAARGTALFPDDARIYALYTQLVKAEADTVLPRGLALFPKSAELHTIRAQELKSRGRAAEALEATRTAVGLDSTLSQGMLAIAQGEFELGRPDSALAALRRSLARGEDSALVAQFALSKGNTLYRAANGTRTRGDFELALRFIALSDSVRGSNQAKFLLGAAALGAAQATLTDAARVANSGNGSSKAEGCALAQAGSVWLPVARQALQAGESVAPEAVQQMNGFLGQLEDVAGKQRAALCTS